MDGRFECKGHGMNESDLCHLKNHGPTSYWMQDPDIVFTELHLKKGDTFLDIGCGTGDYTLRAGMEVGSTGTVYAVDIQYELVESLMNKAQDAGLQNIHAVVNDIRIPLPVENCCIDVCFISTVLHSLDLNKQVPHLFIEIKRVLNQGGRLAIIECNKENLNFGPPLHMHISAKELEQIVTSYGFVQISHVNLGFNYLSTFSIPS